MKLRLTPIPKARFRKPGIVLDLMILPYLARADRLRSGA